MLDFHPLTLEDKEKYEKYYELCMEKSSDTTFVNLWAWSDKYQAKIAFDKDFCWIKIKDNGQYVYGPPLGIWQNKNWKKIFENYGLQKQKFSLIPEALFKQINLAYQNIFSDNTQRDNWEYLYQIADLITLEGEKYRNQRKLSNQFLQNNNYNLKEIHTKDIEKIKIFQEQWMLQPEVSERHLMLEHENTAVCKILNNWQYLEGKLFGYYLSVDEDIVAYTIGEVQDENHIVIHFEKALYTIRGSYPAINRLTLENFSNYQYVNREQDLGIVGLRRAKEEYNPVSFIKKYELILP